MKFGLSLPTGGRYASPEAIAQIAEGAERIGLSSLWTFERLLSPTGLVSMGGQEFPMMEPYNTVYSPLEVLGFAAAKTSRIRLGTSIISALLHNPAALGRSFATLDRLSGGRIVAGLGQGWMREEFEAAGVPVSRQGAGFAEFVQAMRAAWGPDPVSFDGRFFKIAESRLNPKPVQDGGPPIVVGAVAPISIRRAARLGLGFNPVLMSWEALEEAVTTFREAESDPGSLPVVVRVNNSLKDRPVDDRPPLGGSADQVAEDLHRLRALEVDEVFWSMDYDPVPPDAQLERMTELLKIV